MRLDSYPEVLHLVKDLKSWLRQSDPDTLVWNRENEADPLAIDLSFAPPIAETTVETLYDPKVCVMCSRRIGYKPRQFDEELVKLPYLVLIHNSFILAKKQYYEMPSADKLFRKMISAGLGVPTESLLIREVLRCYFGKNDENDPANFSNCVQHIREDIDQYKLKGILILGQAAPVLFGRDKEALEKVTGKITTFEGLPTVVTSGPQRLVYMHSKRFEQAKIDDEKRRILSHLLLFRDEVMSSA
ncbi:MAG: uracil-DNA glycosylase family protein [Leptospirales bacterium]